MTGIEVRHRQGCAARDGKRCTCKSPRYRGVIWDKRAGRNASGKWGSKSEARAWRAQAARELSENGALPTAAQGGPAIAAEAEAFLKGAGAGTIRDRKGRPYKASTIRGYERGLRRVTAELGERPLTQLRRKDVQEFVDKLVSDGHAASTVRNTLDPLRAMCRRAVQREQIAANPTAGVEIPHDHVEEMRVASRAEATKLVAALPESERAFWATALYGGLRSGELRALRWSDVDLGERLINVRRSWDDGGEEVEPKTPGSRRKVPIVPRLAKLLERHAELTGRSGSDLVFGRTAEAPPERSTIRRRALTAWKVAKLEPITVHQCRHTCASFLIAAGCNAKALSVILGHASIAITFDRYGHLMPGGETEAGRLLDRYINGH